MPTSSRPEAVETPVATILSALGDPTRRRIFELLVADGPSTATALSPELDISRQAVAKHLQGLAEAELAVSHRSGRETVYQASVDGLDRLVTWADRTRTLWGSRLDRLERLDRLDR